MTLEVDIENLFVGRAAGRGCMALKYEPQGSRNWPDRIILLCNGTDRVFWIEFKLPGEVPRPGQLHRHNDLRSRGYHVYWCDAVEDAVDFLELELQYETN